MNMEIGFYEEHGLRLARLGRMKVGMAVIGGTALLGAGTSLLAGNTQANAAKNATAQANQTLQNQYNQDVGYEAPYRNAGTTALSTIGQDQSTGTGFAAPFTMSNFMSDPVYQFQLSQGNQAIQRSAAAQGGLLSGAAAKAIAGYTTGLANTTYGDAYNRYLSTSNQQYNQLAGVANMGLNATNATVGAGQNSAAQQAQNTMSGLTQAGAATASGYIGAANALAGGAGGMTNYMNQQQMMQQLNGSGYTGLYGAGGLANVQQGALNSAGNAAIQPGNASYGGYLTPQSTPGYSLSAVGYGA